MEQGLSKNVTGSAKTCHVRILANFEFLHKTQAEVMALLVAKFCFDIPLLRRDIEVIVYITFPVNYKTSDFNRSV